MKTKVRITGQPAGNNKLFMNVTTLDCEVKKELGDVILTFPTKKQAIQALKDACETLKAEEPDFGEIGYGNGILSYDASVAKII